MAYLAKKSRKRGGAYKKSRYAKRRMTGGEYIPPLEYSGDGTTYTICKDETQKCCEWTLYGPGSPGTTESRYNTIRGRLLTKKC